MAARSPTARRGRCAATPAVIKAYLGEPEEEELPPEVAADLAAEGIG